MHLALRYPAALCLLLLCAWLTGQASVGVEYRHGRHLMVERFLLEENQFGRPFREFNGFTIKLSTRDRAPKEWHLRYGHPLRGIGLSYHTVGNDEEMGRPLSLYYHFRAPLLSPGKRWSFDYRSEFGLAAGWKDYDFENNPNNQLISSATTFYISLGLGGSYRINDYLTANVDVALHHFSNGNLRKPNAGLNSIAPILGLRYQPAGRVDRVMPPPPEPFAPSNSLSVSLFGGMEKRLYYPGNIDADKIFPGLTHLLGGVVAMAERRVTYKSTFGIGLSATHRAAGDLQVEAPNGQPVRVEDEQLKWHNLRVGALLGYELTFYRFSVVVRAVYTLRDPWAKNPWSRFRQKIGFRYRPPGKPWFLATVLNARELSKAEYIECQVGYSFSR